MLAGGGATAFAAPDDSTLAGHHFLQQLEILVIDVHRPRTLAIDEDRIVLFGAGAGSSPFAGSAAVVHLAGHAKTLVVGEWSESAAERSACGSPRIENASCWGERLIRT